MSFSICRDLLRREAMPAGCGRTATRRGCEEPLPYGNFPGMSVMTRSVRASLTTLSH